MEKNPQSHISRFLTSLKPSAKEFLLLFASVAIIAIFFTLPQNHDWMNDRIIAYYHDFKWQKSKMGISQRMVDRFEGNYTYSKQIAAFFEKKKNKPAALVLIPPADYFNQHGIEYHVPEPIVFYYYTGLKTLWPNSSNAATANWYVRANNGQIIIDSVTNKQRFADTLTALKKFNIGL